MNGPKRRKGLRRGLPLLLTLCMVFTLLPVSALAEGGGATGKEAYLDGTDVKVKTASASAVYSVVGTFTGWDMGNAIDLVKQESGVYSVTLTSEQLGTTSSGANVEFKVVKDRSYDVAVWGPAGIDANGSPANPNFIVGLSRNEGLTVTLDLNADNGKGAVSFRAGGGSIQSDTGIGTIAGYFGGSATTDLHADPHAITLTDDVSLTDSITFAGGDWSLDLAGHTLELLSGSGKAVQLTGGSLILTDSGATKGGITGRYYAIDQDDGALTLTDGVHLTAVVVGYSAALSANAGTVTIKGAPVLSGGLYTLRVEDTAQLILAAGAAPVCKDGDTGARLNQAQDGLEISAGEFSGTDCGLEVGEELTNLTISGGTFTGAVDEDSTGANLASAAAITGGTFTGGSFGFVSASPASISGGTFTGGLAGACLFEPADGPATWNGMLSGGSFTFTGVSDDGGEGGGGTPPPDSTTSPNDDDDDDDEPILPQSAILLVDGEGTPLPIGGLPAEGCSYFANRSPLALAEGATAVGEKDQAVTVHAIGPEAEYSNDGGATWTQSTLANAIQSVSTGGTIRLLRDLCDTTITIVKTFTLDLNGCGLTSNGTTLAVQSGGALTLTDSVGGGSVTGGDGTESAAACPAVYVDSGGSLTLTGGKAFTLRGGKGYTSGSHTTGAEGVNGVAGSTITVSGTGAFLVQGGDGRADDSYGGNGLDASGTLTATNPNAVFRGGNGGNSDYTPGANGASVQDSGAATLSGGHFEGGSGQDGGAGLYSAGSMTVSGVTCTGGKGGEGGEDGKGLEVKSCSVTVNSGLFSGRYGVYMNDSRLTVTGGTFTGTTAGLYLDSTSGNTATLQGGTFTGSGTGAWAVKTAVSSQKVSDLLGSGYAYFDNGGAKVTTGLDGQTIGQNATLRVAAAGSQPAKLYSIAGTVSSGTQSNLQGAVSLLKDGVVLQTKDFPNTASTFDYTFSNVEPGVYTVQAKTTGSAEKTATVLATVKDANLTGVDLGWSTNQIGAQVEVKPDTPPVAVGGLDKVVEDQGTDPKGDATVLLTAEKQDNPADAANIVAVAGGKELDYLELKLELVVKSNGVTNTTDLGSTNSEVLELVLPYDFTGKQNVTVYRYHDGTATALTALSGPQSPAVDGTFWADTANGYLHIYASKFSTYAVGYDEDGGSATYYTLTATAGEGGAITPSGSVWVFEGGSQSFAIRPQDGYEIADVLVDGKSVGAVASYTFENVAGDHKIAASFTKKARWNPFTDVKPGDWYHDSVKYVYEHDLMNGTSATTFSPELATTRGMIVTILWRMEGEPDSGTAMAFTDVAAGSYYYDAVLWASGHGIVTGYGDGRFGPEDLISREQLAAILWRYAKYKGMDVSVGEDTNILSYIDFDQISEYAIPAMQWACGAGVLEGKGGGMLDPQGQATRAEAAAVLSRFLGKIQ